MMRPSGVLTRFTAHTDYQVRRTRTKKKESVNAAHTGCLDVIKSGVVDDIAVIINLNPATSADTRIDVRSNPNHVRVFF